MAAQNDSPLFSFRGRHCDEFGVAFIPTRYPFIPAQTIPGMTIDSRHGSLRWPGRTFRPTAFEGTMYLMDTAGGVDPILTGEALRRASGIAQWLCGEDGRGKLVLDALDDRYYIAEVNAEAVMSDTDWFSGAMDLTFVCQPFARSLREKTLAVETEANAAKSDTLIVDGNAQTVLAFSVTNISSAAVNAVTIEAPDTRFSFEALQLDAGETLQGSYTDDDILLLRIEGVDGALRSAMALRTTDSDDDLLLMPGRNRVTVKTDRSCKVRLSARGRWH